jgi:ABC-type phosphate transport system permease subunit
MAPERPVDSRSFRRRYFPLGRTLLIIVVLLQVPAWMYILHRSAPPPVQRTGTNAQYALSQTNAAYDSESIGVEIPISQTATLVRNYVPTSIAHVVVEGAHTLQFVFPKGSNVCVSVPAVVYGTPAVPKVVAC